MNVSKDILEQVEAKLSVKILKTFLVTGGSINQTYCLQSEEGKYFIKINNGDKYPGMFDAEAKGLNIIRATNTIDVPDVILNGLHEAGSYLLLEWIDTKVPDAYNAAETGTRLAQMHKSTSGSFGLNHDNYMGSKPQSNKMYATWSSFFIEERLQPMVKIAFNKRLLNNADTTNFELLYKKLPSLFTEESPSLIHGDLWSGNYVISTKNNPYLIDPAVTYGNREFDIAMTTLFGGFSKEFYSAYNEAYPLNKYWRQRVDLWNLYPLLLHLNLFGTGYLSLVKKNLSHYI